MRLSKHQAVIAAQKLRSILGQHPEGMRTSQLSGTPKPRRENVEQPADHPVAPRL